MDGVELDLEHEELRVLREGLSPDELLEEVFLPWLDSKLDAQALKRESARYGIASEGLFVGDWRTRPPWAAAEPLLKAHVAKELALRSGVDQEVVARYMRRMAEDGWSAEGLDMRAAVKEMFGLDTDLIPQKVAAKELAALEHPLPSKPSLVGLALARATYSLTQETLQEMALDKIWLWRGVAFDRPAPLPFVTKGWQARKITDRLPALSTWTLEEASALQYAWWNEGDLVRRVLNAEVPRERVFSTFLSGPGNASEAEVLLLGGDLQMRAMAPKQGS